VAALQVQRGFVLICVFHHAVMDVIGLSLFLQALERSLRGVKLSRASATSRSMQDVALWEREAFRDEVTRSRIEAWRKVWGTNPVFLDLPHPRGTPSVIESRPSVACRLRVSADLKARIVALTAEQNTTTTAAYSLALGLCMWHQSGQPAVSLCAPQAARVIGQTE
jgi:hypothetical protein